MRAYILRPFGTKDGIDFERVSELLIKPALAHLSIEPLAGERSASGNIQVELFNQLATADLVIADISVASTSVYLELGVRYALRDRHTVLVQAQAGVQAWHLRQLRVLWYNPEDPSSFVLQLVSLIQDTIESRRVDSPVYLALPGLEPPSLSELRAAPQTFRDEVDRASRERRPGHLALLALEANTMPWRLEALRLLAGAQMNVRDYAGAQKSLEALRAVDPDDIDTNAKLGTVYDRLGRSSDARLTLERVLAAPAASRVQRADALALSARNLETEWTEFWRSGAAAEWSTRAFRSPLLKTGRDAYLRAYKEDLNHYQSGLSALALTQIQLQLAANQPEVWEERFDSSDESNAERKREEHLVTTVAGAIELSLASAAAQAERTGERDPWLDIGRADLTFLTAKRAQRVARQYEDALSGAPPFLRDSVRRQCQTYADLNVFTENAEAVLRSLGRDGAALPETGLLREVARVLLFTGHMVDGPDRERPRFPADREGEARQAIEQAIQAEAEDFREGKALGLAGGSSGGDILFHEVCRQFAIPSELYLPMPEDEYALRAVMPSGGTWISRFTSLRDSVPVRVLQASTDLPEWLQQKRYYGIWQRNNQWLLQSALAYRGAAVTVIALWNGEQGEGPGGTKDMVTQARAAGASVRILNTSVLFGLK